MADEQKKTKGLKFDPNSIGGTGLNQYGGFVAEEFLTQLRGVRGSTTYREMSDNDPVIGAILFAITMLIRNSEWTFQAADDSPESEDAKVFAEEVFDDMSVSFASVIAEVCSMFTYGFAPMEIIWKKRGGPGGESSTRSAYDDNRIGIRSIALRAQPSIIRWDIDIEDGSINGLYQQPIGRPAVFIPIEKLLLFRTTEERNNPEGRSILRNAYRPWFFKKRIEEIEGVGIERDLAGLPVAKIPAQYFDPKADPTDKAILSAWQTLVTKVRRDQQEGILIPSDRDPQGHPLFEFELLSTGGTRAFDTTKIVDRYDRRIATSVLADFIFLGQQSVGSFALSSDKTALFAAAIGGFMKGIKETFNRHLMPRLWELNGFDREVMPQITHGDLERPDLTAIGEFLSKLSASGAQVFPDRELENHLRQMAGFPLAPEEGDDDFVDPAAEAETPPGGKNPDAEEQDDEGDAVKKDSSLREIVINNVTPISKTAKRITFDTDGMSATIVDVPAAGGES